jgi:hypothetical protein
MMDAFRRREMPIGYQRRSNRFNGHAAPAQWMPGSETAASNAQQLMQFDGR